MTTRYIVSGGGIAGILSALLIREFDAEAEITLVEASPSLGGLLRSFDYGSAGKFDYGTHYLAESGIEEIDALFEAALPSDERHFMSGYRTDVSGVYFRGRLQNNSPCIDLRAHPDHSTYQQAFRDNAADRAIQDVSQADLTAANTFYRERYGARITDQIIAPVVEKLFGKPLADMSEMGTRFTPLGRIILFENEVLETDESLAAGRNALAHTDQRTVPLANQPTLRAFYPKHRGMAQLIEGFERLTAERQIRVLTGHKVDGLKIDGDAITEVRLVSTDGQSAQTLEPDHFIAASGLVSMLSLIPDPVISFKQLNPPKTAVLTHLALRRPIANEGLYYFYCYDDGYKTFRITDYRNYCPEAQSDGDQGKGYPVTVEMMFDSPGDIDPETVDSIAIGELSAMGLLAGADDVLFAKSEVLPYGFPLLTLNNYALFDAFRNQIADMGVGNLIACGALSEKNVYFQRDVIADTYRKIAAHFKHQATGPR